MSVPHVCLPIDLDAFVLNQKVCDPSQAHSDPGSQASSLVTPVTQPNYVNLRLSNDQIQHDVLPGVDLHRSLGDTANPRISMLYQRPFDQTSALSPKSDPNSAFATLPARQGVYLHWSIPRAYRSAVSRATKPANVSPDKASAYPPANTSPSFPLVPNRWLVVRLLQPGSFTPPDANIDKVTAWIIESDRLQTVEDLRFDDNDLPIDLETDVAPFVAWNQNNPGATDIYSQAEKYIGKRRRFDNSSNAWAEQTLTPDQKVDLTIMNTANPLFADYTPCNANVFSTKDNFFYLDANKQPAFLKTAKCDYVVLGWHSDWAVDPLGSSSTDDLSSRLTKLFCAPPNPAGSNDKPTMDALSASGPTRLICHAAKYDVVYSADLPSKVPSNDYARNFTSDVDMEPVSVGTTALDAILAFFQAHSADSLNEALFKDQGGATTAQSIMGLRELLYATEDDYDSRIKAADLVFSHNFARSQAGSVWRFNRRKTANSPPAAPSTTTPTTKIVTSTSATSTSPGAPAKPLALPTEADGLDKNSEVELLQMINEYQKMLDVASAQLAQIKWALFSEWFKYLSDPASKSGDRLNLYQTRIPPLRAEAARLQTYIDDYQNNKIPAITKLVEVKKVAQDPFFQRNDPTLCIAGIDAGWDPLFVKDTPTRFFGQLSTAGSASNRPDISSCVTALQKDGRFLVPMTDNSNRSAPLQATSTKALSNTLVALLQEASKGYQPSLQNFGHRKWDGQPFKPQFVEWEAVYYHVDWPEWSLQSTTSALASSNHPHVTYVNPHDLSKLPQLDRRTIAGRILVVPQPSFALGAVVAQVFDATPADQFVGPLADYKDVAKRKDLIQKASSLRFISGELSGLTDALLTMAKGQHVQPNLRNQGQEAVPMQAAIDATSKDLKLALGDFKTMGSETGRTPYGTLENFSASDKPFKSVQHGQFAITRLTIVDKFGQAVACPAPKRKARPSDESFVASPPVSNLTLLHPCLSEQLIPSLLNQELNTIYTTKDTHDAATASKTPMTPFVQLSPSINQEARINAAFLKNVAGKNSSTGWQPCSEWENPIFGWIIINYADSALQFFTQDGTFYTSLEFGGPTGTIESIKWAPFDQPPASQALVSPQLQQLLAKLSDPTNGAGVQYLKALWEIVRSAIPTMPFPPSEYSAYANAIVGKPLALVNAGWSLELAQSPYWAQNTLPPPRNPGPKDLYDPLRDDAARTMAGYKFKVKIGDAERPFDGVVAYWDTDNKNTEIADQANSSTKTNFGTIWSYTSSETTKTVGKLIEPDSYPTLTPYFIHPDLVTTQTAGSHPGDPVTNSYDTAAFSRLHNAQLLVRTLLMDPYTPVHLYSGILPIKALQLASWTVQQALKNMTAFFTVGPLLISRDVPKLYDPLHPLKADTWLTPPTTNPVDVPDPINLPIAGGKGMWNWLQPYMTSVSVVDPRTNKSKQVPQTKYNSLTVGSEDGRLRLEQAPYTFVEGYLQLAAPLIQPQVPSETSAGVATGADAGPGASTGTALRSSATRGS